MAVGAPDRSSRLTARSGRPAEEQWISVSDLMAGLMMVFLFVSVALMRAALAERDKIQEIAVAYREQQVAICNALYQEFEKDLPGWQAVLDSTTLALEFQSPEVLFARGDITIQPRFREILADFFPRYVRVLSDYRDAISEVRIEGHTSSIWNRESTEDEAYFNNMALSQGRTRAVLHYVYNLPALASERDWMKQTVAAVGFSSAHLKRKPDGTEDLEASRRVTFRVITNAETQIKKILEG